MAEKHWIIEIPFFKAIFIILSIIYCVAPAIIYTYVLAPDIYNNMELFKMLLLSLSFSTLVFASNFFILLIINGFISKTLMNDVKIYHDTALSIILNYSAVSLIGILCYLIYGTVLSLQTTLILFYFMCLAFPALSFLFAFRTKRANKPKAE